MPLDLPSDFDSPASGSLTAARLASRAAIRSGTSCGSSSVGWIAISWPSALASISSSTFSRYSSWYFEGSKSDDSESISCWAILSSRSEVLRSLVDGTSSRSSAGTTSSWKIIVSIVSTSPSPGRIATSCSLERSTTRAIATLPDSRIASSSSP